MSHKAVLIGLDGATFSILDPLMQEGVMPFLKSLIASGVRAELTSVIPALTPPAWTSLMTGRSPGNHSIFDFLRFELRSGTRQLRVLDSGDVACPTIWSMLARQGRKATVLNFPMTFPVRGVDGNVVPGWVPWRHLRLACYPSTLYERLTTSVPNFNPRQLAMDMSLEERALEGCHTKEDYETLIRLHIERERQWFSVLRHLMREEPADLTAVLFDGVDKLQHFLQRCVALSEWHLATLVLLPILHVDVGDPRVMLFQVRDRIVSTCEEVSDIQVDPHVLRERRGLREVVRTVHVVVQRNDDIVLLRERCHPREYC